MFDFLTLSVVIDGQIFCVHGGIVPGPRSSFPFFTVSFPEVGSVFRILFIECWHSKDFVSMCLFDILDSNVVIPEDLFQDSPRQSTNSIKSW
jgi:hypothetical protein